MSNYRNIYTADGKPYPERFPDVNLSDSELPLRIEFAQLCPIKDDKNRKQVNIEVGAMRIYLRTKNADGKRKDLMLLTICRGVIKRNSEDRLPYFFVHPSVGGAVTISQELREALMRHIVSNPYIGRYCRDKLGRGARDQWETSLPSIALLELHQMKSSSKPSG